VVKWLVFIESNKLVGGKKGSCDWLIFFFLKLNASRKLISHANHTPSWMRP
jgi:hypothetical protein